MNDVFKKVLNPFAIKVNPFAIKVTSAGKPFVYLGTLTTVVLHVAFYVALIHFIAKIW